MSHSLIVISPVSRLQNVGGKMVESLGAMIAGDGVLTIPLVTPPDLQTITHWTCHAGGTSAAAVAKVEAVYAGALPATALPEGMTAQDIADALAEITVSIDGRIMGVDADWPEERLTGKPHLSSVLSRFGLEQLPVDELI